MEMEKKYKSEYQSSPCVTHSKEWPQIDECILCESLGEDVNSLLCMWEILQWYHLLMHQDPDVVHVYLYVIGPISMYWISGNIYFTFIFTPNDSGWIKCKTKLSNNALQPHTLCSCVHSSSILGLNWWKGYSVMFITWPVYGTMFKREYITWSGLFSNGVSILIRISKSN